MTSQLPVPAASIGGAKRAHARLVATLADLTDAAARAPSRLPDWTVGHVLTHLARNADSHIWLLEQAALGRMVDQYPGGAAQREGDIAAGADRPAADLVADVRGACTRLEAAWDATTEETWGNGRGRYGGGVERPIADLPFHRWREVEVHHADLGLGFTWRDWDGAYVAEELQGLADAHTLTAWLLGRHVPDGWPAAPPWPRR